MFCFDLKCQLFLLQLKVKRTRIHTITFLKFPFVDLASVSNAFPFPAWKNILTSFWFAGGRVSLCSSVWPQTRFLHLVFQVPGMWYACLWCTLMFCSSGNLHIVSLFTLLSLFCPWLLKMSVMTPYWAVQEEVGSWKRWQQKKISEYITTKS